MDSRPDHGPSSFADRDRLALTPGQRLRGLLLNLISSNAFYARKMRSADIDVRALHFPEDLAKLPLTTKAELIADQAEHMPWGTALSEPLEHYTRYCQTSSTTGAPLRWI